MSIAQLTPQQVQDCLKKQPVPEAEAPAEPSEEVLLLREIRDSLKK